MILRGTFYLDQARVMSATLSRLCFCLLVRETRPGRKSIDKGSRVSREKWKNLSCVTFLNLTSIRPGKKLVNANRKLTYIAEIIILSSWFIKLAYISKAQSIMVSSYITISKQTMKMNRGELHRKCYCLFYSL